jgi:hypothetical protein
MFPLQAERIDFDNNEDPMGVIATFIAIIRYALSLGFFFSLVAVVVFVVVVVVVFVVVVVS